MSYELDRLGWLQFQQLCAHVLELDAGVPGDAWRGDADGTRTAVLDAGLGPPLLRTELPARVLVHCAWLRPGSGRSVDAALGQLSIQELDDLRGITSYLLMGNGNLAQDAPAPTVKGLAVGVIDTQALSARIDARPEQIADGTVRRVLDDL